MHIPSTKSREACTGIAASWCPIHGDCSCPLETTLGAPGERRTLNDEHCPLHSPRSTHAEVSP